MTKGLLVRVGACLVVCAVGCGGNSSSGTTGSSGNGATGSSGSASTGNGSSGSASTGNGSSGSASTGNGGGANCQTVAPCGGDVTGTWKVTSVCDATQAVDLGDGGTCAGLTLQLTVLDYEGTISFGAGSYTSLLTSGSLGETLTEPTSCFGQNTSAASCDELSAALMDSDSGTTGTCSLSGSNCICNGTEAVAAQTSTGTYTTSGTTITLDDSNGGPQTSGYCVQGNTLYLDQSAASSMMGAGAPAGNLVLTKQ